MSDEQENGENVVEAHLVPKPNVIPWLDEIVGFYETDAYSS